MEVTKTKTESCLQHQLMVEEEEIQNGAVKETDFMMDVVVENKIKYHFVRE